MLRSSLFTASAFALAASAAAQTTPLTDTATKITGAVKYGGTFHVATQTWTRGQTTVSNFGQADNIYSNTAGSGYYTGTVGPTGAAALGTITDEAHIPSTGDPAAFALGGPGRDSSTVTEVQIGYCDFDAGFQVAGWTLNFYEQYDPCTYPPVGTPQGVVTVANAPSGGCWIIDLDLTGGGEFSFAHDGEGIHDASDPLDSFGIEWSYTGTGTAAAGLLITGDPANTDTGWVFGGAPSTGSNTYYGEVGGCPGSGSGYDNGDLYWIENVNSVGTFNSGCYFFGGYNNTGNACGGPTNTPYGAYWIEMTGDGSGPPVGVISTPGCVGANNSTGVPGECRAEGVAQVAANNVTLFAFQVPANQFCLFVNGPAAIPPGTLAVGNGFLCINPSTAGGATGLGRFNTIKNSGPQGIATLSTTANEWNLAAIPGANAPYAAIAGTTTHFQSWHRDTVGAGSNVTGSCLVLWQ